MKNKINWNIVKENLITNRTQRVKIKIELKLN